MELEIVSEKDNPLLERVELEVTIRHEGEPTPKRDEIRELVATQRKAEKARVIVDHMTSTFGKGETHGYVKVYGNKRAALAIEERPIIERHGLGSGKDKAEGKGAGTKAEAPVKERAGAKEAGDAADAAGAADAADAADDGSED